MKISIINGPNLNLLGEREPEIYGRRTYRDLVGFLSEKCRENGVMPEIFQSNSEGKIIDEIQRVGKSCDGIIINAGGYTHTSVAICDALKAINIPSVEVHLSDINTREDFRRMSYISLATVKTFAGHGFDSYAEAIEFLVEHFKNEDEKR